MRTVYPKGIWVLIPHLTSASLDNKVSLANLSKKKNPGDFNPAPGNTPDPPSNAPKPPWNAHFWGGVYINPIPFASRFPRDSRK